MIEQEKNEELGVTMVPDHIVLTVDEKEKLFEGMFAIFCVTVWVIPNKSDRLAYRFSYFRVEGQNITNIKEFETESSETVKIATVETEEFSTEEIFEKSSDPTEESEELEDVQSELPSSLLPSEAGSSDDEPISISIDEPKVEMNDSSKQNEVVAIQFTEV